jgi:DnaJ-class molecular chaperone
MAEQQQCGACNGQGGTWITRDGQTPGKNLQQWVACAACKGTGTVTK